MIMIIIYLFIFIIIYFYWVLFSIEIPRVDKNSSQTDMLALLGFRGGGSDRAVAIYFQFLESLF